jgi:hypothetical protein
VALRQPLLCNRGIVYINLQSETNRVFSPPNAESSSMSSDPYVKGNSTHCVDQVTNKTPNSFAQQRARRQVSPVSGLSTIRLWCALALHRLATLVPGRRKPASAALPLSSSSTPPGSSILTDSPKGSSSTGKYGRRWIGKKFKKITNRRRCTPFAQHPLTTAD